MQVGVGLAVYRRRAATVPTTVPTTVPIVVRRSNKETAEHHSEGGAHQDAEGRGRGEQLSGGEILYNIENDLFLE